MTSRLNRVLASAAGLATVIAGPARSQMPMQGATPLASVRSVDATAGSMTERTLLLAGLLSAEGVSTIARPRIRRSRDSLKTTSTVSWVRRHVALTTPVATMWVNSQRAAVDRDGAVWQGRGVTMALSAGMLADIGPLSVSLRPLVSTSQNADYSPVYGPRPTDLRDPLYGARIDLPYRFGRRVYSLVAPGETWVSLNAWKFNFGGTTASQAWGPAHYYPLMLGTEAGGYPRLFVEARELPLGLARVNTQWSLGRLEASPVSGLPAGGRSRFASAFIASFAPAGMRGLNFGVSRFFHGRFDRGSIGLQTAMLPFARLYKGANSSEITSQSVNQLASVFARVAPPGAGVEAYFEFLRDDHNADLRDLVGEPDHESAYTVGLRRAWRVGESMRAVTVETVNGRISHLWKVRPEFPPYIHADITEGHTFLGQPLGSLAAFGGGGFVVAYDIVEPHRSRLFEAEMRRIGQTEEGGTFAGRPTGVFSVRASTWRDRGKVSLGASLGGALSMPHMPGNNVTVMLSVRGRSLH